MAEEKLGMSLDDLIKKNKTEKKPPQKAKGGGKGGGGPSGMEVDGRGKGGKAAGALAPRGAGVAKKGRGGAQFNGGRGSGRPQGGRGSGAFAPRPAKQNEAVRRAALEGDAAWSHDMFDGAAGPRRSLQNRLGGGGAQSGTMLVVSNLDFKVSDQDVRELFEVYGQLRRCSIKFDRSGRSSGVAEVVYENKADALRAKQRYNEVALDGRPMKIELREGGVIKTLSSGITLTEPGSRGGGGGGGGRTNLTITRNFEQATNGAGRSDGRVLTVPRPGGAARRGPKAVQSRVVRGRGNVSANFLDRMQE